MSAHRTEWDIEPVRYELPGFRWAPFSVPCEGIDKRATGGDFTTRKGRASMPFQHIEKLKETYTDKYVTIGEVVPELKRFEGRVGIVRTVNMSGRALVEFLGTNDISWYDIDVDFLKIVDKPAEETLPPKPAERVKANDATPQRPAAERKKPAKTGASTADILALARGKKPAATEEEVAENRPTASKPSSKPSTADILAMARGKGKKPASPPADEKKQLTTAEKLALLRGEKKPDPPATSAETPQAKPSTADILAMARGEKKPAPTQITPPPETSDQQPAAKEPKKPTTAEILAMARKAKQSKTEPEPTDDGPAEGTPAKKPSGDAPSPKGTSTADILKQCRQSDS